MWNEIKNQTERQNFRDALWFFHDSCIKEIRYLSGAYVPEERAIAFWYSACRLENLRRLRDWNFFNQGLTHIEGKI